MREFEGRTLGFEDGRAVGNFVGLDEGFDVEIAGDGLGTPLGLIGDDVGKEKKFDEFIDNTSNLKYYVLNTFFYIKVIFSDFSYIILNLIIDFETSFFYKNRAKGGLNRR